MAKSVRISDPLFEHATLESTLMHRSIAIPESVPMPARSRVDRSPRQKELRVIGILIESSGEIRDRLGVFQQLSVGRGA